MTTSMNRTTGAEISGEDYDAQCIADLLTTPLGSSVMRPEYGWIGQEIIDRPLNRATGLLLTSAAVMAMRRWLPDIRVAKVALTGDFAAGSAALTVTRQRLSASTSLIAQTIPLSR